MDLILNGQAFGDVASLLVKNGMDVAALRPWEGKDGRSYILVNGQAVPMVNATATRRYSRRMRCLSIAACVLAIVVVVAVVVVVLAVKG
ncbi:MAG: hypothetical protein ABFE07_29590 [Armatimonadia bacterium]